MNRLILRILTGGSFPRALNEGTCFIAQGSDMNTEIFRCEKYLRVCDWWFALEKL
jgi:hypothetical protein